MQIILVPPVIVNVSGNQAISGTQSAWVSPNNYTTHDPMPEYMEWYGYDSEAISTRAFASLENIREKTWTITEIHDWMLGSCEGDVFVQKMNSMWVFTFTDPADYDKFSIWWPGKTKKHQFVFTFPGNYNEADAAEKQIGDWLLSSCQSKNVLRRAGATVCAWIRGDDDAVHFRLAFANLIP